MRKISAYEYILISVANEFGGDKWLWQERIDWTTNNDSKLESLVSEADSPILYSKAVRSLRMVQRGEETNIPVSMDATASFLQIMSIMTCCEKSAKASNMIDTGSREDIYSVVMEYMNTTYSLSTCRQDIKDSLMPWAYGSTATPKEVFGDDTVEHRAFLGTIKDRLPGASLCMDIMKLTWNSSKSVHSWTRDDGSHVHCPVIGKEKKRIVCGKSSFTHIANINKPMDKGISNLANFIQSVDSMIMARMVKMAHDQGYELYGIHDSFWCSAVHMQKTRENYLNIMIDLASKPILFSWFEQMTGVKLPEPDKQKVESFISKIKNAEYFLS